MEWDNDGPRCMFNKKSVFCHSGVPKGSERLRQLQNELVVKLGSRYGGGRKKKERSGRGSPKVHS